MANYDDLLGAAEEKPAFDKAVWKEKKQKERKELYALADKTAGEIAADGGKFQSYLDVQATFLRYSATNALLIMAQMPEATQLRDFSGWKKADVSVNKNAKGLRILEPGKQYAGSGGNRSNYFNVKTVFDISQTDSKAEPRKLYETKKLLRAMLDSSPVKVQPVDKLPGGMGAVFNQKENIINASKGMTADNIFRSVITEIAHVELSKVRENYNRDSAAFVAYSASYLLCKRYGIDTSQFSFKEMPEAMKNAEVKDVRKVLGEIRDTADTISTRIYRKLEPQRSTKEKEAER